MPKTESEMIQELYTVTIGIPGTRNKGIIGDVREIKTELQRLNGSVTTNTTWRKAFCFIIPLITSGLGVVLGVMFL